jgi:uncharacterized RDD family membrane protein YckC
MTPASEIDRLELAEAGIAYAGFWRRLLAYLIDTLLLFGVQVSLAAGVILLAPGDFRAIANLAPVSAAMSWAYFSLMESSPLGATVGKLALGLYVTDAHGDPISFVRASARYWLKIASTLLLMLGWLMAGFTPRKQALHDLIAGTLVLRTTNLATNPRTARKLPGEYWDGTRWAAPDATRGEG